MKTYHSSELRSMFLKFFKDHGHAVISSASVIPENDPTVLFTTAGMHPLVPYLLGSQASRGHTPDGRAEVRAHRRHRRCGRLSATSPSLKCWATGRLGDYFKEQMIPWSWEFLTSPEYLGIDPDRLAFTVFAGDDGLPRATRKARSCGASCGVTDDHIFFLPKEEQLVGPGGRHRPLRPGYRDVHHHRRSPAARTARPACSCGAYLEIWNDVFMEYNKKADGTYEPLPQKNVDTGMGLERTICVLNGKKSVYETDAVRRHPRPRSSELCGKEYAPR